MKLITYKLTSDVYLETFDDGALVLKLKDISLTELNVAARDILVYTDGINNIQKVAQHLAEEYDIPIDEACQDVGELYQQLIEQGILEPVTSLEEKEG
jgi:hypothetical protein